MKLNGKSLKMMFAFVLAIGMLLLTIIVLSPTTHRGTNLNFPIRSGTVTIENVSSETVSIQILGTGTRIFRVISDLPALSGTSTRMGTGREITQVFEITLPQGITEFMVSGGTNISLIANSTTPLKAVVKNLSETESQVLVIFAGLVIAGSIFYLLPIKRLRRNNATSPVPPTTTIENTQGDAVHSYGDNRRAH